MNFRNSDLLSADISIDFLDGMAELSGLGPDFFGGLGSAMLFSYCLLILWYAVIHYIESISKFTVF